MKPNSKPKPYPRRKIFNPTLWDDITISKRMRKPPPWIHYLKNWTDPKAVCGKDDMYRGNCGPKMTENIKHVTCPRCIEVLKKVHWYCPEHGFIDDENVTFEENCEFCGMPV